MYVTRKTFAEFMYPDGDHPGTLEFFSYEVPPGDRDPLVPSHLGGPPPDAIGVRFYDIVAAEVQDPLTGKPIECQSTRLDPTVGNTFYRGLVYDETTIKAQSPVPAEILNAMNYNGWQKIIIFEDGTVLPFNEAIDRVLP